MCLQVSCFLNLVPRPPVAIAPLTLFVQYTARREGSNSASITMIGSVLHFDLRLLPVFLHLHGLPPPSSPGFAFCKTTTVFINPTAIKSASMRVQNK